MTLKSLATGDRLYVLTNYNAPKEAMDLCWNRQLDDIIPEGEHTLNSVDHIVVISLQTERGISNT